MKILFVTDLYPVKSGEATTPVTLHNFVTEWIKSGHDVEVIKPNFILNSFLRKKPFYKTGSYEFEGIKVHNINYFTPFLFDITKKLPLDFAGFDIIIAHMPSGVIFGNKLAQKFNKPLVCGVHASDIEVLKTPIYSLYFKKQMQEAYKKSNKIACRSFVLQKKFKDLIPEFYDKTFVAASGVDFVPEKAKGGTFGSTIKVLTCANLIKRKNIDKLIMAIKDLQGFELKIIGDGSEFKHLKKIGSKLSKKVLFLGCLTHEKVLEQMKKADIFILPSVNETFGMVYLEAMATGCITICTENDGIDGIINDGENGFICEPTVEGIKQVLLKIKTLGTSENVALQKILEKSIDTVKKYSHESCAKNYLDNLK